jgi:uncharacterized membrane-anchored protein YhcB (DUF1043 family)
MMFFLGLIVGVIVTFVFLKFIKQRLKKGQGKDKDFKKLPLVKKLHNILGYIVMRLAIDQ